MDDPARIWQVNIESLADTRRVAADLAARIEVPMTIALCGSLGAGKTQLVRDFADHLGVSAESVTSPTYVLVQRYQGRHLLYHLDFYRLESIDQVWDLGLDEMLESPVVTLIEWADKFPESLPDDYLRIDLSLRSDGSRTLRIEPHGRRAESILGSGR